MMQNIQTLAAAVVALERYQRITRIVLLFLLAFNVAALCVYISIEDTYDAPSASVSPSTVPTCTACAACAPPPAPLLTAEEFRAAWLAAGDAHAALATRDAERVRRAGEYVTALAAARQRAAIDSHSSHTPVFDIWIDKAGWEDVEHPQEFWETVARAALPKYRVSAYWYNTPTQYVNIHAFADG
jgi:hypothetical protein